MAFPWAAAIGAAGSLGGGLMTLFGQQGQQQNQQNALQMAMHNYMLNKRIADQQYELATASETDARGNRRRYVPGTGWVTDLTPQSQSLINQSDKIAQTRGTDELIRGADERSRNFNRRIVEGSTANPLLDAMRFGYGAPTREGVTGANKIAGVTSATEAADDVKGGYNAAALRTGMGGVPLQSTIASADKGATAGIRTALAQGDASGDALFNEMLHKWRGGQLDPYNMLATRASNAEGSSFQPESISSGLDSGTTQRASIGANVAGRGAAGINSSFNPLLATMISQRTPNYGGFIGGVTDQILSFFDKKKNSDPTILNATDRGAW